MIAINKNRIEESEELKRKLTLNLFKLQDAMIEKMIS